MSTSWQAVRVVGGVLPPGTLDRVQTGDVAKRSLDPVSYHLAGRETVRDAASREWAYLRGAWTDWRERDDTSAKSARSRWLLPLLNRLGYGQVQPSPGYTVDERDYPVSHAWQHVPIHLLGPDVDLDHRKAGIEGAERAPQAMVQELLNRSEVNLWAVLSNGLRLRLLRDSTALAGSAYLEFDLELIFEQELYAEFLLLFQLCHESRLELRGGPESTPADCWLEAWRDESVASGTRALDHLRDGVEAALTALGTGFLHHPANRALVDALHNGHLSQQQLHRALLRLAYRLLFLFVTEDRDLLLLPLPDAAASSFHAINTARERYAAFYSTGRLRRLSRIRAGGRHRDLWAAQRVVLRALGGDGRGGLALPALGGLFDPDRREPVIRGLGQAPDGRSDLLLGCELSNQDMLTAIRHLAWIQPPGQRTQPVDYRNLGAEELGSVYESLLELVPNVDLEDRRFRLATVAGNERKTTGSYYTPRSLVAALVDSALQPLIDEAVKEAANPADAERRLLALTVCDPASGSGHFLVAAARRIARALAQVRAGDDEPTPPAVQHALREVIGGCIYGVDVNDMAADLTKVSLWLEALEPGKPLGFLDARIRVGNSLLGTTPALIESGIPDGAYKPLDGDDRAVARDALKRNKKARDVDSQETLPFVMFLGEAAATAPLAAERRGLLSLAEDVAAARAQAEKLERYEQSDAYLGPKTRADAWCAAFVWPMAQDQVEPPTTTTLREIAEDPGRLDLEPIVAKAEEIAQQYRFFHWHIEFPEIFAIDGAVGRQGWRGGFSCLLGNPPWERIKLQEKEFFDGRDDEIANAPKAATRKKMIEALATSDRPGDRALYEQWTSALRESAGFSKIVRESGRYPLTATGDINTYAIFAETFRTVLDARGQLGMIVPTGIATDSTTQHFFRDLVATRTLTSLFAFVNEDKLFVAVHHDVRFTLLTISGARRPSFAVNMVFWIRRVEQIASHAYRIAPDEITLLNPNTNTCPVFRSRRDAEITIDVYRRIPVLWGPDGNPWGLSFMAMFHMANDSGLFRTAAEMEVEGWRLDGNVYGRGDDRMLPLYEAKMAHHFDHRFSTYAGATQAQLNVGTLPRLTEAQHADPDAAPMPRYWVAEPEVEEALAANPSRGKPAWTHSWLLGWRDVTNTGNERTVISTVIPRFAANHKLLLALPRVVRSGLQANLTSFVLDYVARQKLSGTSMGYFIVRQLPVIPPERYDEPAAWIGTTLDEWIRDRVLELTYTSYDIVGYARDLGDEGAPFVWDAGRREAIRAELDAAYFHLYGIARDDVDYIMDTFKVVREKDERAHGEYRTKRLIVEAYDAMRYAIDSGVAYRSALDPLPGHGPRHPRRTAHSGTATST